VETLTALFVGRPPAILIVAALFLAGSLLLRSTALGAGRRPRPLLVGAAAWAFYGAWEWLVWMRTPEANIRIDLLLIWPVLAVLSVGVLLRALR
jgi:hypothetical protein